jgi:hypothetical protein
MLIIRQAMTGGTPNIAATAARHRTTPILFPSRVIPWPVWIDVVTVRPLRIYEVAL